MKRTLLFLTVLSFCIGAMAQETGRLSTHRFRSGGIERTYKLYLPDKLPPHAPLIFVLHGYGGNADPSPYGMNPVADRNGFAVCYPQGERDSRDKSCWNVGYPFQKGMKIDDVDFLCSLARYLQKHYGLSRRNTFCTGMSNGGEMCYLLAYRRPDVFAAVAPVAGLTLEWMYRQLVANRPIPLFEIHGTQDKTSMWNGDPDNSGGWGEYIAVPVAVGYWTAHNRCTHEISDTVRSISPASDHRIIRHKYVNGTDGCEVWLYEIENGTHTWGQKDLNTAEEIWAFFSKFVRPDK